MGAMTIAFAASGAKPTAGPFVILAFGVVFTVVGITLSFNIRGMAEHFLKTTAKSVSWMPQVRVDERSMQQVRFSQRLVGIVFLVVGPALLVDFILKLLRS